MQVKRNQTVLNEKRINWLMDNMHLWYRCRIVDPEWFENELKNKMRRAGLYNFNTRNESMNIKPLMEKARKRLDHEKEIY